MGIKRFAPDEGDAGRRIYLILMTGGERSRGLAPTSTTDFGEKTASRA